MIDETWIYHYIPKIKNSQNNGFSDECAPKMALSSDGKIMFFNYFFEIRMERVHEIVHRLFGKRKKAITETYYASILYQLETAFACFGSTYRTWDSEELARVW